MGYVRGFAVRIGWIGVGEVGGLLGQALAGQPGVTAVAGYDVKFVQGDHTHAAMARAQALGVEPVVSLAQLAQQADVLISAVTAANTEAVALAAAKVMQPGQWLLDLNSASPGTKAACAQHLEAVGARYVEAGVMTSVPPHGLRVPMVLSGPHAQALAPTLTAWGMQVRVVSAEWGVASAIKMSRSVMIKGLEALVIEAYTNARAYGVEDWVLPTLTETFPGMDWQAQGDYFFQRVVQHGKRRAEEMTEAARTVQEGGFAPLMAAAIAQKQQAVADAAAAGVFNQVPSKARWQDHADAWLARRQP